MLLIYGAQDIEDARSPEEAEALMNEYGGFSEMLQSRNAMLSGEALHPTTTATTVRVRDGKTLTTDGPFAETKEQLGGYYVVEAKDIEEAIEFASKIPNARDGSVEVRPVMVFG
jgi:hypothetical protein